MSDTSAPTPPRNSPRQILFASLVGTAIEFFDFYIYAAAAVLVFPKLFFPAGDPASATLQSLATFGLAFFARPIGAALFGHYGDRIGRKATLVAALLTMGFSTVLIGLLPTYASIGFAAPLLLALCRLGQGIGLGGELGGAVLLAIENAPPGKRAWYGMFPQLGAPLGFICSTSTFLVLTQTLTDEEFLTYGWRIPFVASALLVALGLYVRLRIHETPEFQRAIENRERVRMPLVTVARTHTGALVLGACGAIAVFALFYLMTVFTLGWGTSALGYARQDFLILQMIGVLFFALMIPISAALAVRRGALPVLIAGMVCIVLFGLVYSPLFAAQSTTRVLLFLALGLGIMGFTYGPLGTALAELYPTSVRYTGSSLSLNLAGILGASMAPYIATWLAMRYGLAAVGYYLSAAGCVSLAALLLMAKEGRRSDAVPAGEHVLIAFVPGRMPWELPVETNETLNTQESRSGRLLVRRRQHPGKIVEGRHRRLQRLDVGTNSLGIGRRSPEMSLSKSLFTCWKWKEKSASPP